MITIKDICISPKNEYCPLLVFCWNGKLDHERITEQIDWIKEAGYGGFMIMAYLGLPYKVMDESWINTVEVALKRAEEHGLDEDFCRPVQEKERV